jgi:hypothetical protein
MRRIPHLVLLLAALATSAACFAGSPQPGLAQRLTPQQMHDTGLDTLTPEQLALLDRLLAETAAPSPPDASPRGAPMPEGEHVGLLDAPVHTRAIGDIAGWAPGTVFVLENGQRWKVLKGSLTLRKPMASPEVVLVPGLSGRWFLQVDEDLPKARVYRID